MIFTRILPLSLALFPAFVLSGYELNPDQVPQSCRDICEPISNLTSTCDVDDGSMSDEQEDLLERQCICTNDSFDVANRTALCAGCVDQAYGGNNGTTGGGGNNGTTTGGGGGNNGTTTGGGGGNNGTTTGGGGGNNGTAAGGGNNNNSTGQANLSSIMSVCGFSSQSFASNMTAATSANVTATRPVGTGDLTTTISTGVPHTGGGGGVGGGGGGGPDETAAPGAGARIGMSNVGLVGALFAGVMIGL